MPAMVEQKPGDALEQGLEGGDGSRPSAQALTPLQQDFLAQTARIPFSELQRYFAAGKLLCVAPGLDLIELAVALAKDDAALVKGQLASGGLAPAQDADAARWLDAGQSLWAVVVDPWVLVQEDNSLSLTE